MVEWAIFKFRGLLSNNKNIFCIFGEIFANKYLFSK